MALHLNQSLPFFALHLELVLKGRPANNLFYPKMYVAHNEWGGVLAGNFCVPSADADWYGIRPKLLINWVHFDENMYHPHMEAFSCRHEGVAKTVVDITGEFGSRSVGVFGN